MGGGGPLFDYRNDWIEAHERMDEKLRKAHKEEEEKRKLLDSLDSFRVTLNPLVYQSIVNKRPLTKDEFNEGREFITQLYGSNAYTQKYINKPESEMDKANSEKYYHVDNKHKPEKFNPYSRWFTKKS